ncbi:MAG: hypothetical protein AAF518_04815 [Spirochaetota bacterium]
MIDTKTGCYRFTKNNFPAQFYEGCIGLRGICDGGIHSIYKKIVLLDNEASIDYILFNIDGTVLIEIQDSFRYKHLFKNNKWHKEGGHIVVTGKFLSNDYRYFARKYLYGRCKSIHKELQGDTTYESACKQEWQEDLQKMYGKRSFYVDYTLKISLDIKGKLILQWQTEDKGAVPGKKRITASPEYLFPREDVPNGSHAKDYLKHNPLCLKPI